MPRTPGLLALICSACATSAGLRADGNGGTASDLLGTGRGIDHVGIFVRDLEATGRVYSETLGFTIYPGGSFPDGIRSSGLMFSTSYVELLTVDAEQATGQALARAEFLQRHQGAVFLALHVSSAEDTAAFLRKRGFDVAEPQGGSVAPQGTQEPLPELFQIVSFPANTDPAELFFIGYNQPPEESSRTEDESFARFRRHPNTAKRLASVRVAVKDKERAAKTYEAMGLPASRKMEVKTMGAKACEVKAGDGWILLLQPDDPGGRTARFLSQRGEGIIGISIEVSSLATARKHLESNAKHEFPNYDGLYGNSILIPSELALGLAIEMFEK